MQDKRQRALSAPHACAACGGPVGRGLAENLWFHSGVPSIRYKMYWALAAAGVEAMVEHDCVKAPVTDVSDPEPGAVVPIVARVSAALTANECGQVTVAWIMNGADATRALAEAPTLAALEFELEHRWFTRLLDDGGLYMHFQPIVFVGRREVAAYEALVRATHDGRELSGGEIVATAQETGLLVPLDARTRVRAIEQFAAHGLESQLFINFQPSTIYSPRYCLRATFSVLERTALRPENIVFEVIESEDVDDLAHLRRVMDMYRSHGLKVAMDDFGVGYSTHQRLLRLRPDYIKLDRSLTVAVAYDAAAQDHVASLVRLGAQEGCRVIAEGIETAAQHNIIRDLGIELAQGYLYARPALQPRVIWPEEGYNH